MPSVTELARMWRVSHQYVSKLAKKGMPLNSFESASDWRNTYAGRRLRTDSRQLRLLYGDEDSVKRNGNEKRSPRTTCLLQKCLNRPLPPPDSLDFCFESARRAEQGAYILFQQALEVRRELKIVAALRNYNAALEGRLKIERWYRKEIEYRRHLIPMATARELACKGLNVLVSKLLALPDKAGSLCNPKSPSHGIAILRDECMSIVVDIKKSWPKEFDDGVVWPGPLLTTGWSNFVLLHHSRSDPMVATL